MPRSVKEWFPHKPDGTPNDDATIPPRVKLRIKSRANDCCQICGIRVRYGGQVDHTIALINGGENRESNLRFLCRACHAGKTRDDVSQKAKAARTQASLAGFKRTRKPFYLPKPEKPKGEWVFWQDENGRDRSTWVPPGSTEDVERGGT